MLTVTVKTAGQYQAILARAQQVGPVLNILGAMVKSEAQGAFQAQRLGTIRWLRRYPSASDADFVNVAGVVQDFNSGKSEPQPNRFERRPAGVDRGTLQQSIAYQVKGKTVEIGSVVPYASAHNKGLVSRQPVTLATVAALSRWLKTERGAPYRKRLGFLFQTEVLETEVVKRPFLGFTDQMQKDFPRAVERWVALGELGAR